MDKLKSTIVSSLYFDKRTVKKNGKFPLRIQLFNSKTRKQRYFPTDYEFTAEEYNQIYTLKTTSDRKWHLKLSELLLKVKETIEQTKPFSFDEFEKKLYNKFTSNDLVNKIFQSKIDLEIANEKIRTADVYKFTLRSIENYLTSKNSNIDFLSISEIDAKWLNKYNDYLVKVRLNSVATIGINMRNLRTIWNIALTEKIVDSESNPFGKNKFQIKTQTKINFVLFSEDIKKLINTIPKTKSQEMAKDFWLLSFYCCGLNLTDFALFKKQNLNKQNIKFFRKKSEDTKIDDIEIVIPLRKEITEILDKYINIANYYLFSIVEENDDATTKIKKIKKFNDVINKNLKKLCNGMFDENFTYYTARHSWATNSIIAGAPLTYIQQQLGHTDPKTTMNYIARLPSIASKPYVDNFFEQLLDI